MHCPTKNLTLRSVASELFALEIFLCQQEDFIENWPLFPGNHLADSTHA